MNCAKEKWAARKAMYRMRKANRTGTMVRHYYELHEEATSAYLWCRSDLLKRQETRHA